MAQTCRDWAQYSGNNVVDQIDSGLWTIRLGGGKQKALAFVYSAWDTRWCTFQSPISFSFPWFTGKSRPCSELVFKTYSIRRLNISHCSGCMATAHSTMTYIQQEGKIGEPLKQIFCRSSRKSQKQRISSRLSCGSVTDSPLPLSCSSLHTQGSCITPPRARVSV